MDDAGADILKDSCNAGKTGRMCLHSFAATYEETKRTTHPVITMAMSGMGAVSRISGEIFGSSVTFASVEECSAPGQLPHR